MPATVLAVDTATDVCSVALAAGELLDERAETVGQKHSERVLPMVQAMLLERRIRLAECDAIAFGAGPGAFTGLRIACGVAQGLAFGVGKAVVPIGNLEALAFVASRRTPNACRILVAIDARMQEIYWAVYSNDAGMTLEIAAPALASAGDLPALCDRYAPDLVAGNALRAFPEQAGRLGCALLPDATASASGIAVLARFAFAAGRAVSPGQAAPIYVRDRVALTVEERRGATASRAGAAR